MAACVNGRWLLVDRYGFAKLGSQHGTVDVLAIEHGLRKLEALDSRKAKVVEAKVYGGLSHEEIATVLGVSLSTVEGDWRLAKAWLARELGRGEGSSHGSGGL
jgi:DNA-directed RNA polymerase specialized sigma24 family protein